MGLKYFVPFIDVGLFSVMCKIGWSIPATNSTLQVPEPKIAEFADNIDEAAWTQHFLKFCGHKF